MLWGSGTGGRRDLADLLYEVDHELVDVRLVQEDRDVGVVVAHGTVAIFLCSTQSALEFDIQKEVKGGTSTIVLTTS